MNLLIMLIEKNVIRRRKGEEELEVTSKSTFTRPPSSYQNFCHHIHLLSTIQLIRELEILQESVSTIGQVFIFVFNDFR